MNHAKKKKGKFSQRKTRKRKSTKVDMSVNLLKRLEHIMVPGRIRWNSYLQDLIEQAKRTNKETTGLQNPPRGYIVIPQFSYS